jgi:hypothetical protein
VVVTTATEAARLRLDRHAAELVRLARSNPFAREVGESRRDERAGFLARRRHLGTLADSPLRGENGGRLRRFVAVGLNQG